MKLFKITTLKDICVAFQHPYDIYEFIIEYIFNENVRECSWQAHSEAENAQAWCELACIGDEYDGGEFTIECIEV